MASDVNEEKLSAAKEKFSSELNKRVELRLTSIGDNDILSESVDIVSPCGFGSVLNDATIPTLKCKIICGAANNQLADPVNGDKAIQKKGFAYTLY